VLKERLNKYSTGWNINGAISLINFGPKPSGLEDFFYIQVFDKFTKLFCL